MQSIKRENCSILPLVLKEKWYNLICVGKKKEEYRDYKEHWIKRIENWQDKRFDGNLFGDERIDVIAFSAGYRKPDMFFKCDRIEIREGTPQHLDWGEPKSRHFVIGLGERVEIED